MKRILPLLFAVVIMFTSCAQKNDHIVRINTKYGEMIAILYDETPKHKENFIKLAKEHYYDSLLFHRVIPEFMIQGGDPDSKKAAPGQQLGMGGPSYTIDAEFNLKYFHEKGALSAARLGDAQNPAKASSGSQFYIVQGRKATKEELTIDQNKLNMAMQKFFQNEANRPLYDTIVAYYNARDMQGYTNYIIKIKPRVEQETGINFEKEIAPERLAAYTSVGGAWHLDGGYTVFGKVIKGLDVIDKIAAQPRAGERPVEDIRMFVKVEEMSRKKIEKEFGYKYPEAKNNP